MITDEILEPQPRKPKDVAKTFTPVGDRRAPYVYGNDRHGEEIFLAVNVALATGRPLLLRGAPGCGKSSLARDVAIRLKRRYYEHVVSSRMTARDLQWSFDAVRRLSDAQASDKDRKAWVDVLDRYIEPGTLWWAFDPVDARKRGSGAPDEVVPPRADPGEGPADATGAVVLIDEIDKAEPDVPNDLLIPLGAGKFRVAETDHPVEAKRPVLVVLTTNEERELPGALLRRCVVLEMKRPHVERCLEIARSHFTKEEVDDDVLRDLARRFEELAVDAEQRGLRPPGTAEYLDAIGACVQFGVKPGSRHFATVTDRALWKHSDAPKALSAELTALAGG